MARQQIMSSVLKAPLLGGTFLVGVACLAPPSDAYGNELFRDNFDTGALSPAQNGVSWDGSVSTSVSDDIARSGTHSLKFAYSPGPPDDDSWAEQRFNLPDMPDIWLDWYQYFPNGTEGIGPRWMHRNAPGPNNNKFLRLWYGDELSPGLRVGASFDNPLSSDDAIICEFTKSGKGGMGKFCLAGARGVTDFIPRSLTRGTWHRITWHIKVATSANNDGIIDLWIDGHKVMEDHRADIFPVDAPADNYFQAGYLMGWANSGFDERSYTYIDDFVISDSPIALIVPRAPILHEIQ